MTPLLLSLLWFAVDQVPRYDVFELELQSKSGHTNPFVDVRLETVFIHVSGIEQTIEGFFDGDGTGGQQGCIFKVRFSPMISGRWSFQTRSNDPSLDGQRGEFECVDSDLPGPVVVSKQHPHHFVFEQTNRPFFHLGFTAYHLLDPSNDAATVQQTIEYCAKNRFNKIRFLIAGYPRDSGSSVDKSDIDLSRQPNYGAPAGEVNPLPVWLGKPHHYDFTRFNLAYWHKLDRAVQSMNEHGMIACLIFTIEKQNLPNEYGALTANEKRFYRYGVARLGAFSNVWWDLGNEHNEYRNREWANEIGRLIKRHDPHQRLCSVHAYADWLFGNADWADFIITQQYGTPAQVNAWVLAHRAIPKPYVNEEYGYEGKKEEYGHGQNADRTRKCHWAIALAGGYATYGDWTERTGYYTGEPDAGVAATQLQHLRTFAESIDFHQLEPDNDRLSSGFCLTDQRSVLAAYLPEGGDSRVDLTSINGPSFLRWFDPRNGGFSEPQIIHGGKPIEIAAPSNEDWALLIHPAVDED